MASDSVLSDFLRSTILIILSMSYRIPSLYKNLYWVLLISDLKAVEKL